MSKINISTNTGARGQTDFSSGLTVEKAVEHAGCDAAELQLPDVDSVLYEMNGRPVAGSAQVLEGAKIMVTYLYEDLTEVNVPEHEMEED